MSSPDRRATPRHIPLFSSVFLARKGEAGFLFVRARLIDLSSGGAGVAIYGPLSRGGTLWIGLEGTSMREWARAEIVRVQPTELGTSRVGLRFTHPCPIYFFKRAIWGKSPMDLSSTSRATRPRP